METFNRRGLLALAIGCTSLGSGCGGDVAEPEGSTGSPSDGACPHGVAGESLPEGTLALGPWEPSGVAVDGTSVYWTTRGTLGKSDGAVLKVPVGGGQVTVMACGQRYPSSITADGSSVYWSSVDGISRMPRDGGMPELLTAGPGLVMSLAVDGTSVYWTSRGSLGAEPTGGVHKVPIEGGPVQTLADQQTDPRGLMVTATEVYWASAGVSGQPSGSIARVPLDGGPAAIIASGLAGPAGIAVDATRIYWSGGDGTVSAMAIKGGAPTVVASAPGVPGSDLVLEGANLYWTTGGDAHRQVMQAPAAGGEAIPLTPGDANAQGFALDDENVYWTDSGDVHDQQGRVVRMPR